MAINQEDLGGRDVGRGYTVAVMDLAGNTEMFDPSAAYQRLDQELSELLNALWYLQPAMGGWDRGEKALRVPSKMDALRVQQLNGEADEEVLEAYRLGMIRSLMKKYLYLSAVKRELSERLDVRQYSSEGEIVSAVLDLLKDYPFLQEFGTKSGLAS